MPRNLTDRTAAMRQLWEKHGLGLTHQEARPLLKKLGVKIAPKPKRRTADETTWHKAWDAYDVDYNDPSSIDSTVEAVAKECGFDAPTAKQLHRAEMRQRAFVSERNHYDCSKVNYAKLLESGAATPSARPLDSRNTKAKTAAAAAAAGEINTFKEGGRGRKECPKCGVFVAARSAVCACGHEFSKNTTSQLPPPKYGDKSKSSPAPKPTKAPKNPEAQAEVTALLYVEKHGGLAKVRETIADLEAQVAEAKQAVELVEALHKRVAAVEAA